MNDLSMKELASLIADAIYGGEFKTKEAALPRIEVLLSNFIRISKDKPRPVSNKKSGEKLERAIHSLRIKDTEALYWRRKVRYFAPNRMEEFYAEVDQLVSTLTKQQTDALNSKYGSQD